MVSDTPPPSRGGLAESRREGRPLTSTHSSTLKTMTADQSIPTTWKIKEGPGTGYNDEIVTVSHPRKSKYGPTPARGKYDVEEDGYPVVVTESGIDEDGHVTYYEKREITGPAKSWEDAKEQVRLSEDEKITEEGVSGLQSGGPGEVDYYAVEVLTPDPDA